MSIMKYLEKDVPECYYKMAMLMGSVDYYMFYESWAGKPTEQDVRKHELDELPFGREIADGLNLLVKQVYVDGIGGDEAADVMERIFALRDRIKKLALDLVTYSDAITLYEYIINRNRPADVQEPKNFNDDAAARDVLTAIFSSGENVVINENIKLAVSQLPIRMSKARFFDLLRNSLEKYTGTDSSSFDRELYMIRTAAGLEALHADVYPVFNDCFDCLRNLDLDNLDPEAAKNAHDRLEEAVSVIMDLNELYRAAVSVLNKLGIAAICRKYIDPECFKENEIVRVLANEAVEGISSDVSSDITGEALASLRKLEGLFEPLTERIQRLQARAVKDKGQDVDDEIVEMCRDFDICERLISNSAYADLTDPESHALESSEVAEACDELEEEFRELLSEEAKVMGRARMAAALAQLPVFFDSRTEVMNYVRDSLGSCRDAYEKSVAVKLIVDTAGGTDKK